MEQNEKKEMTGLVHSIESFGSVDGPGIRYIFFLKGCHMRCQYCHNPDTWAKDGGEYMTPQQAFDKAYRYKTYWRKNGGITVSGGEALLQPEFVTELFKIAKKKRVHTCLDTSGNPFTREEPYFSKFNELMEYTDLFLLDIKEINDEKHKKLTGWTNANILDLAQYLSEHGKDMWIRYVLVPGVTDDEEDLKKLGEFVSSLKTVQRFEVLPYHTLGVFKWDELGLEYALKGVNPPTKEEVDRANAILNTAAYTGYMK
ncbi:MAG: pyruvate formate-lyase-activating protein [Lachnospiraceae bacterium]|nr:pyruvate formate-lyase-activating protein [Lachnospiraceae bacterium]